MRILLSEERQSPHEPGKRNPGEETMANTNPWKLVGTSMGI